MQNAGLPMQDRRRNSSGLGQTNAPNEGAHQLPVQGNLLFAFVGAIAANVCDGGGTMINQPHPQNPMCNPAHLDVCVRGGG
eukprot:1876661-Rhodomonas_salina.1